jgi:hypothetical protein
MKRLSASMFSSKCGNASSAVAFEKLIEMPAERLPSIAGIQGFRPLQ